jgi:hypothetical protein
MISYQRLRDVLHYDPITGEFTWLRTLSMRAVAGQKAGSVDRVNGRNGRILIRVDGKCYRAHQLAWLYMTGEWPAAEIDHRDLNGRNNRWRNLRLASRHDNVRNCAKRSHSRWPFKGVRQLRSGRWNARVRLEGREINIGTFDTVEQAHEAYMAKARELFGEFARAA